MSRYLNAKIRIVRRLGPLPGLTKKITTRTRYPGQHDRKPGASSEYAIRLDEKQKLKYNYGISEKQLYNYIKKARKMTGSTGILLLQMLEMRLDNIVFRLGFATTMPESRQLVNHGHILVNGQSVSIASFQCKKGDVITVKPKSKTLIQSIRETNANHISSIPLPKFLELNTEDLKGEIKYMIEREQVGLTINELLVVEYYSRK